MIERVPIAEFATEVSRPVALDPGVPYKSVGVKWYGAGVHVHEVREGHLFEAERFQIQTNDIIYNDMWARMGSVAIVPTALSGAVASSHFPTFQVDQSRALPAYLSWYFRSPPFWDDCELASRGSTGRNQIKRKTFLAIEIPLLTIDEQHRIVARIEELAAKVEEARRLREQSLEELEAITAAQTTKVFDTLSGHPHKELSVLGVDGENPIQIGPFGAQLHASEFVPEGVPVLNVGNVWPTGLRLQSLDYVTTSKAAQLSRYEIKVGDLLFARSGATLGKVCLVPPECDGWLMTGHLFRVRFDPSMIFNRYAFAALRGAKQVHDQVFGQVRGATRPGYNTTLLGSVQLPVPPLDEQFRIVAELDALQAKVDAVKALQAETAAELDAMLPAILDKAFKGEL